MIESTRAVVQSNWGYKQSSLEATADLLVGKDVTVLSYRIGKVIGAKVSNGEVVLTITTEVQNAK
jgi:hypothetical protein